MRSLLLTDCSGHGPSTAALHDDHVMVAPAPKELYDACVAYSHKDLDWQ